MFSWFNKNKNYNNDSNNMASVRQLIETANAAHKVVVYSKSFCPHCTSTKQLFTSISDKVPASDVIIYELDKRADGSAIQAELEKMTGQRTVPNVFVMNTHIGGNDNTQAAYKNGSLLKLLNV